MGRAIHKVFLLFHIFFVFSDLFYFLIFYL